MDWFIGEIRAMPYDFAPEGWALCDGARMQVSKYQALFAVIGNRYGGDGNIYFNLPNLVADKKKRQGAAAVGMGKGKDLTERSLGPDCYGSAGVTLELAQTPVHSHRFVTKNFKNTDDTIADPRNRLIARGIVNNPSTTDAPFSIFAPFNEKAKVAFRAPALGSFGEGKPHDNLQPALALNFCIAIDGEFPVRSSE